MKASDLIRVTIVAVIAITLSVTVGVVGAQEQSVEESSGFVIELEETGDATVSLVLTYDLEDEQDLDSFEQMRANTVNTTDRFESRLSRIAERTAVETDREMSVSDPEMTVETQGERGVIRLSVSWTNLAATQDETLHVSEPFSNEFDPDRPLVLIAPDGYTFADSTVTADSTGTQTAQWDSGTDLSGFATTIAAADSTGTDSGSVVDSAPVGTDDTGSLLVVPFLGIIAAAGGFLSRVR